MKRKLLALLGLATAGLAGLLLIIMPATGADHADAPLVSARDDQDIADLYVFRGETSGSVAMILSVRSFTFPGDTPVFDTGTVYEFKVDQDGDATADVAYRMSFGAADTDGVQTITVRRADTGAEDFANTGEEIASGATTAPGDSPNVIEEGDVRVFAGLRDDAFFFDTNAFLLGLKFQEPGVNFYTGFNSLAIVIEVPEDDLAADGTFGVWGTTSVGGTVQDRAGRPGIATVLVPMASRNDYNATRPSQDVSRWKSTFVARLTELGADPALADTLLPDILTVDTSMPLAYLNGRAPADDVIDGTLKLLTGDPAATDFVENDSALLNNFPFLGVPNPGQLPATTVNAVATQTAIASGAGGSPTPAPPAPAATATRPTGVSAPNTGTGPGDNGSGMPVLTLILGAAAIVGLAVAGGFGLRARSSEARAHD